MTSGSVRLQGAMQPQGSLSDGETAEGTSSSSGHDEPESSIPALKEQVSSSATLSADGEWTPLPYDTPMKLWRAFKNGAKFVLHYHGKTFDVTNMEPREKVVYVQPPGLPVKVLPNGRSAEGPGPGIWLAAKTEPGNALRTVQTPAPAAGVPREAQPSVAQGMADEYQRWIDFYHAGKGDYGDFLRAALRTSREPTEGDAR